ncbi:MAG: D-aminoacyl-tRNA deacylase [Clostridia bacterium]|nr:D-aminoacyl-tRNA deacylase [Clostridia bacterium]
MRAVLQRVTHAKVVSDGVLTGEIEKGLFILLGVHRGDDEKDADLLAEKIAKCRIFSDENDKMNLCVNDVGGGALVVSNFTLYANYSKGNRPDYFDSEGPERANQLYEIFVHKLKKLIPTVGTGVFGAHMQIDTVCDGPVTIVMDSDVLRK